MRIRLPSLAALADDARSSARRFPATLIASLATGAVALTRTWTESFDPTRIMTTLGLAIPLTFAVASWAERRRATTGERMAAAVGLGAVLGLWFASYPVQTPIQFGSRTAQLALAAHLVVAFLPYVGAGRAGGFWEWNAALFVRFVTAGLFSSVLFVGVIVALLTMNGLLGLTVPEPTYLRVWLVVAFGFNTWFFLAGVPDPLPDGPLPTGYPRGLRVLTQYLLIPLVTLYVAILYAYVLKILFEWTWPEGTIGYLVSAFAILGILNLLLVHPLQEDREHRWIRTYARWFYLALLPLVVLLVLGAWRRVGEYGITERRYFLLALGLWIGGVAAYFTVSARRDIRAVPITLCAVVLATMVGPWGAYEVSRRSQLARLAQAFERSGLLREGRLVPPSTPVDFSARQDMSSILDYLNETHGGAGLEDWFDAEAADPEEKESTQRSAAMLASIGIDYVSRSSSPEAEGRIDFHSDWSSAAATGVPLPVGGYDVLFGAQFYADKPGGRVAIDWQERTIELVRTQDRGSIELTDGRSSAVLPMAEMISRMEATERRYEIPRETMALTVETETFAAKVYFHRLGMRRTETDVEVMDSSATVLIRLQNSAS